MPVTRGRWCAAVLAIAILAGPTGHGAAPPAARVALSSARAKQLAALGVRKEKALVAGDFEEVWRLAKEETAFRHLWQGRHYWETINARWGEDGWRLLCKVPKKQRPQIV